MKWFKILRYVLLALVVAIAFIQLKPHLNDFSQLAALQGKINYYWVAAAILSQMLQYIGDGWLSVLVLKMLGITMQMKNTLRIAALNVFAAHMLPVGEAGGIAAAYHFYRKLGLSAEQFVFLTIVWGLLTNILLFSMFIVPIVYLPSVPIPIAPSTTVLIILMLIGVFLLSSILARRNIMRLAHHLLDRHSWAAHVFTFLSNFAVYRSVVKRHPDLFFLAILATGIYYASNVATLAFAFLAFGELPSVWLLTFAFAASLLFGRIALAPAGIGAAEATLILIFVNSGIDGAVVLASVVLFRLISFWLPIPAGFLSYLSLRKEKPAVSAVGRL